MLYTEYEQAFSELEPEEQGALIMAIFSYVRTGEVVPLSGGSAMAFLFIRSQLDRDWEKYDEIREKRAEAGRKGGKQTQANRANAYIAKQTQAKQGMYMYLIMILIMWMGMVMWRGIQAIRLMWQDGPHRLLQK